MISGEGVNGLVAKNIVHVCEMSDRVVVEAALEDEIDYNVLFWSIGV